VYKGIYM